MNNIQHLQTATTPAPLEDLAFLYVSGDLVADQLEMFERLLDESQAAREAVANACELTELMIAARSSATCVRAAHIRDIPTVATQANSDPSGTREPITADQRYTTTSSSGATAGRVPRGRLLRWEMAVTTLALLLLLLSGWYHIRAHRFLTGDSNHAAPVQTNSDLALAWSRTQSDAVADEELSLTAHDLLVGSDMSGDELPTWLLAAVSANAVKPLEPETVPPSENPSDNDQEET
jgi:hypothetical protein